MELQAVDGKHDDRMKEVGSTRTVAIVLSTYNGAPYLSEQLASFEAQSYPHWCLLWRDDGSCDDTRSIMAAFAIRVGEGRCREVTSCVRRLGAQSSFLLLMRAAQDYPFVAFADQDDVWLPDKLSRSVQYMDRVSGTRPALYCGRQILVDKFLRPLRLSPRFSPSLPFPAPLVQNIATGCTVLLNQAAVSAITRTQPPENSMHDWWSYIVVTALDGQITFDTTPCILYRQHGNNVVGGPGVVRRVWRALHKKPASVLRVIDDHAGALQNSIPDLPVKTDAQLSYLRQALRGSFRQRLRYILSGTLRRQFWTESVLLAFWVLSGCL